MYRHRLGHLARQQRQQLGLSVRAAAKAAGVDRATWTALEDGSRVTQDRHYGAIERVLQWPAGYIESVLAGEHPDAAEPSQPELLDDNERKIWSMVLVDEDLRRDYIRMYRARRRRADESRETG